MLVPTTLVALTGLLTTASLGAAIAIPQTGINTPTTGGVGPLVPESVEVEYYQGSWSPSAPACGTKVSNGTLKSNTCTPICVLGISIHQVPEADCLFTVFKGTQTCTSPYEVVSYAIGAGQGGMVCVDVGVEQSCGGPSTGGMGGASGVWSCG